MQNPIPDNIHLRVFVCREKTIDTDWNMHNVFDTFWRFYWNEDDGASLVLPDQAFTLHRHTGYFVPSGVRFDCCCTRPLTHFYIHFDVIGLPSVMLRELFAAPITLHSSDARAHTVRLLARAQEQDGPPDAATLCRMKAMLFAGLADYLAAVPAERMERCGRLTAAMRPVLPAVARIEEDPARSHTNRELADCCCLSETHFIRLFRESMGQTPGRFVQERRLLLAAQRLLFTEDSIERIAEEGGFGNRFYFSRLFTRHTGVSPAAYRKAKRV